MALPTLIRQDLKGVRDGKKEKKQTVTQRGKKNIKVFLEKCRDVPTLESLPALFYVMSSFVTLFIVFIFLFFLIPFFIFCHSSVFYFTIPHFVLFLYHSFVSLHLKDSYSTFRKVAVSHEGAIVHELFRISQDKRERS